VKKHNRLEILVVRFKAKTKRTTNKQKIKEKKIQQQQSQVDYYTKKKREKETVHRQHSNFISHVTKKQN